MILILVRVPCYTSVCYFGVKLTMEKDSSPGYCIFLLAGLVKLHREAAVEETEGMFSDLMRTGRFRGQQNSKKDPTFWPD